MTWFEKFKESLKEKLGLTDEQAKLIAALEAPPEEKPTPPPVTPPVVPPGQTAIPHITQEQHTELLAKIDNLTNLYLGEKKKTEDREKAISDQAEVERQKKISDKIEEMKKDGRIPAKAEETEKQWTALLQKDYEATLKIADALPKTGVKPETPKANEAGTGANPNIFESRKVLLDKAAEAFKPVE